MKIIDAKGIVKNYKTDKVITKALEGIDISKVKIYIYLFYIKKVCKAF